MKFNLAKIETQLQTLIEGSVLKLFSSKNPLGELGDQLLFALKTGLRAEVNNKTVAPDVFTIIAHPSYLTKLKTQKNWQETLLAKIICEAEKQNYSFMCSPAIQLVEDASLSPQKVEIGTQISVDRITTTTDLDIEMWECEKNLPQNAFLIVNGNQTFPLSSAVINIGRRPDNDLVIDDPRVSRLHAQLRYQKGHFVIFDLDSTGGTTVNGKKIHQWVLSPGDVISLAGVPVVYGHETPQLGETDRWIADTPAKSL